MYRAAICEDEKDIAEYIRRTLVNEFNKNNTHVEFDVFTSGEMLLKMFRGHYHFDMVFMDIEMPEMDGISISREIKKIQDSTLVVFISNKEELVFSTFEVQPFRFVRKSHYDNFLPNLVPSIIIELERRHPSIIKFIEPQSKDVFSFDINKILYVEAQGKQCIVHCAESETAIKIKFMEIEEMLGKFWFLKPHRSYLVNYKYVSVITKNTMELTSGASIPISRDRVERLKHEFVQYTNQSL